MKDNVEPYATDDTALAAYLYTMGMTVLGTRPNPEDPQRKQFIFIDDPKRKEYESNYQSGLDKVSARRYFSSYRSVIKYVHKD